MLSKFSNSSFTLLPSASNSSLLSAVSSSLTTLLSSSKCTLLSTAEVNILSLPNISSADINATINNANMATSTFFFLKSIFFPFSNLSYFILS